MHRRSKRVSDTHFRTTLGDRLGDARYWWRYTVGDAVGKRRGLVVVSGCVATLVAFGAGLVFVISSAAGFLPSAAEPVRVPTGAVQAPVAVTTSAPPTVRPATPARASPRATKPPTPHPTGREGAAVSPGRRP